MQQIKLDKKEKWVFAGLGNPGSEHKMSYHNIGSLFVEKITEMNGGEKINYSEKAYTTSKKENIFFITTNLFMNESGIAIKRALEYYKIKPEHLVVIHDDVDIALGSYKTSFGKGTAGHKGVLSVVNSLHTNRFWRIRVGICKKSNGKKIKAGSYVLNPITKDDQAKLDTVLNEIKTYFLSGSN